MVDRIASRMSSGRFCWRQNCLSMPERRVRCTVPDSTVPPWLFASTSRIMGGNLGQAMSPVPCHAPHDGEGGPDEDARPDVLLRFRPESFELGGVLGAESSGRYVMRIILAGIRAGNPPGILGGWKRTFVGYAPPGKATRLSP